MKTINVKSCVQCGFCCKKSSCGFGEYDEEEKRCEHLVLKDTVDGINRYYCKNIKEIQRFPTAKYSPAFGFGCCANLNSVREQVISAFYSNIDQLVKIENYME